MGVPTCTEAYIRIRFCSIPPPVSISYTAAFVYRLLRHVLDLDLYCSKEQQNFCLKDLATLYAQICFFCLEAALHLLHVCQT